MNMRGLRSKLQEKGVPENNKFPKQDKKKEQKMLDNLFRNFWLNGEEINCIESNLTAPHLPLEEELFWKTEFLKK